jgi:hypothetical protein
VGAAGTCANYTGRPTGNPPTHAVKQRDTHVIERTVVTQKNEISRDFLETVLDDLGERPDVLPTVFRREVQLAAGLASNPRTAKKAPAELVRAARCAGLMFVHAAHGNARTFIALDDKIQVDLQGKVDPSFVHAPAWVEAMWCALACGDELAQEWLATVPPSGLPAEGVRHGRYLLPLGEFLRSLVTRDGRHGDWLAQAIEASGDKGDAALRATHDSADQIQLPALRAAFHWLSDDPDGFDEALALLHDGHRRYWSSAENRLAVDGLLSLRGCALLRLAARSGFRPAFTSAYMPAAIWQAPPVTQPVCCPYCVLPLPQEAPACGPCGRAIQDALLELPARAGPRTPCSRCAYPLQRLAVICPQCRQARR